MNELSYTVEYDGHLGLYKWQVVPGARLLTATLPSLPPNLRVVALGGGTGLPILLKGLKTAFFPPGRIDGRAGNQNHISAIVTVSDDGGSSGRLRKTYGVLPPGDIRNCLLALADVDAKIAAIFYFRFNGSGELTDHSLGNLILTALCELEKDFARAVERGSEILRVRGQVLPATLDDISLLAEFADGSVVEGESNIASVRRAIRRVKLKPEAAQAFPAASRAIEAADLVVIGPGSLYTSLISILLIQELADAIARAKARVVLVMNLMTEPGETEGYSAADHILAIRRHAPQVPIHDVLFNMTPIPEEQIERYGAEGAAPIPVGVEPLRTLGCRPVVRDLLAVGPTVRHDPYKLAQAVLDLSTEKME